ncbi:MAG: PilZ domain-containing protein, partial [Phycisphaerae bacterium]
PLVATMRGEGGWTLMRSRFIPRDPGGGRLFIEPPTLESQDADQRIPIELTPGQHLGFTFRRGHHKCMFASTVIGRQRIPINQELHVDAVMIRRPDELQQLQRRAFFRVPVPAGITVAARIQRLAGESPSAPGEAAESVVCGQVRDLSAGGVCIQLPAGAEMHPRIGDPFRITIQAERSDPIVADAVYRHTHLDERGEILLGLQLIGFETTRQGRKSLGALTRLIRTLSRDGDS